MKDEVLTVLGTSSSESALVPMMQKLERIGCSKSVVGLVVPSGMSFNMDGTNIYLTMAAMFIAQAMNIDLTWQQQLSLLGVAMLTSKGMAGVFGGSFITLAATLAVVPTIPAAGLALILGVDRFLAEIRTATNFIGNGVAAIVISRWEKELDRTRLAAELGGRPALSEAVVHEERAGVRARPARYLRCVFRYCSYRLSLSFRYVRHGRGSALSQ
jgi:Na+/H+-dicarboxylate symporter